MKSISYFLLATVLGNLLATKTAESQSNSSLIKSTRDLAKYVGTYPCSNGLLKQPSLLSSLKDILDGDYRAYREHMKFSGCGAIEKRGDFLLMDVSQLHVGGYTSLIFIRLSDGVAFLFWLKGNVAEKDYSFYGPRPIPAPISEIVGSELNTAWGHRAKFRVYGDKVDIQLVDSVVPQ